MLILRDKNAVSDLSSAMLRELIQRRIEEMNEFCEWDADELGPFVVVEPGETSEDIRSVTGFSILQNLFNDIRFGEQGFSPAFEFAESHDDQMFELVYVVGDGGAAYNIIILNSPDIDPALLDFCNTYAVSGS